MWESIRKLGIGQRWDGEDPSRLRRYFERGRGPGAEPGLEFVEPNLPLELSVLPTSIPVVTHSSELGLASTGPLNPHMLEALAQQVRAVDPPWSGEHFSLVTPWGSGDLGYNAAPILDREAVEAGIEHVAAVQRHYGCPLAVEAGPRYLDVRGWDDHAAILEISKATDCGILVDVSHHLVSMLNLGRDPHDGLSDEVLERTVELHLTGLGRHRDGRYFHDFHGGPVDEAAWALLRWVLGRTPNLKAITLEHDATVSDDDYARDLARLWREAERWRAA